MISEKSLVNRLRQDSHIREVRYLMVGVPCYLVLILRVRTA